ncbi:hematopoietic death receptor isoform 2-T2 [Polymixia lowei]
MGVFGCLLIWTLCLTTPLSLSGLEVTGVGGRTRTQRDISCSFELEYPSGNICCLNCPAGSHMKSACTRDGQRGTCEECDFGTHTEHSNGLPQCLKCTKCRSDQEIVKECTPTQDTECQCKSGLFCAHDQACEVCKKCSRCGEDETVEKKCNSTSNTVCKKGQPSSAASRTALIVLSVIAVVILVAIFAWKMWGRRRARGGERSADVLREVEVDDMTNLEEWQNKENQGVDSSQLHLLPQQCLQPVRAKCPTGEEDEDKGLGDSLVNTASNSQNSLSGQPLPSFPTTSPRPSPVVPRHSHTREDEPLPKLVPLNGEDSLRRCFEYFEEMDVDYHKRFFRYLGINDNVIKSKDNLHHEDRIHDLLTVWMEKVGKGASLNDLLNALVALSQRLTAENVMTKAIDNGHYAREK